MKESIADDDSNCFSKTYSFLLNTKFGEMISYTFNPLWPWRTNSSCHFWSNCILYQLYMQS